MDRVDPIKTLYVQGSGEWSSVNGFGLRGEAGLKLPLGLGVFGYGEWRPAETVAGVGARWTL